MRAYRVLPRDLVKVGNCITPSRKPLHADVEQIAPLIRRVKTEKAGHHRSLSTDTVRDISHISSLLKFTAAD